MAGPGYRLKKYEYQSQTQCIVDSFTPIVLTQDEMNDLENLFSKS